ncbi:histone-lysine N-methyltransferase SETMAR [Trichonephila clavipes]|nr:histone-lysine N-methyltransferase SETMAR [Trichonephila clavipes]
MAERTEQRIGIKFCFNLGKSCAETIEMLQKAFKDECMGKTQIKEWYGRFKNCRTSVDSDPRSGRPSTGTSSHNVERVRVAVEQDRRLTVRELEDEIRITKSTVWRILTENLGMTRVCAKFIPKLLSDQQKNLRLEIAQDNLEMINMEVSVGATAEKSPSKSKQHQVNVVVFFYYEGIVHHEYAHTGQKINKEYYVEVLKRLRNAIRRKRPQLRESGDWLLHHDNAPAHTSNLVQQYLSKHSIAQLRQPPYSPDIAPCDFWLFPRLKMPLKGHRFDNKQTVETNATNALKAISKTDFQECFNKWKHRYEQLVQPNGDYFEGCHPPDDEE